MSFECAICSSTLQLSQDEKQELVTSLYIEKDGTLKIDAQKAWYQDIINEYNLGRASRRNQGLAQTSGISTNEIELMWEQVSHILEQQQEIVATACGHTYHRHCLDRWFKARRDYLLPPSCPYCNYELNEQELCKLRVKYPKEEPKHQKATSRESGGDEGENLETDRYLRISLFMLFLLLLISSTFCAILIGAE